MNRPALLSMLILVLAGVGWIRTATAGPPFRADVVVTALTERLRDGDASVRQAAVFALREMGPQAKTAIPVLAELLRDQDG